MSMKPNDSTLVVRSKWIFKDTMMLRNFDSAREAFNPHSRGYHAVYRDGEVNHCPGCGRTHWHIGRLSAECAFCTTALPLKDAMMQGPAPQVVFWRSRPANYAELQAA